MERNHYVRVGPEDVPKADSREAVRSDSEGSCWRVRFLVIAAPRPFGWPDLGTIQASVTGGRFFCFLGVKR